MNCKTCKQSCYWKGSAKGPDHGKCLVGYVPLTNFDVVTRSPQALADLLFRATGCISVRDCDDNWTCDSCWLE